MASCVSGSIPYSLCRSRPNASYRRFIEDYFKIELFAGRSQGLLHPLTGQFVGAFVVFVPGVALDPAPVDLVAGPGRIQPLPQVVILHRLLVGGLPAPRLP